MVFMLFKTSFYSMLKTINIITLSFLIYIYIYLFFSYCNINLFIFYFILFDGFFFFLF
ncbi:hypothetical protein H8356DRAFT_1686174 [Neocallimastix lanati (nom. inval.)]|nr:hypothetical protein H8356DRAFT_1686174 [Neocallimastix sp. JGI-2020a]